MTEDRWNALLKIKDELPNGNALTLVGVKCTSISYTTPSDMKLGWWERIKLLFRGKARHGFQAAKIGWLRYASELVELPHTPAKYLSLPLDGEWVLDKHTGGRILPNGQILLVKDRPVKPNSKCDKGEQLALCEKVTLIRRGTGHFTYHVYWGFEETEMGKRFCRRFSRLAGVTKNQE